MMRMLYLLWVILFSSSAFAEPIKIGVIAALTGSLSNIGADVRDGINLQAGGQVEFVFEDDGFNPKNTVTAAQKLLADPSVKGLITFGSGTSLAIKPLVEKSGIPTIVIAISDKVVENSKNIFRYNLSPEGQSELISAEIQRRNLKRVVLVTSQQEAMIGLQNLLRTAPGVLPEGLVEVAPGDIDLRGVVTKILGMKPDGICLLLLPPELPTFARLVKQFGYRGELFGPAQLTNLDAIKVADGALDGAWVTASNLEPGKQVFEKLQKVGARKYSTEALYGFDSAGLLVAALATSNPVEFLRNPVSYKGVYGNQLGLSIPHVFQPPLQLKVIKGLDLMPLQ